MPKCDFSKVAKHCSKIGGKVLLTEAAVKRCSWEKLLCNFIEIVLQHGCSPVNLLHIFRTPLDSCS